MNLNDGDTLRSILTLERWVRDAHEVKLALNVFMAINSNNYVKFFKLVCKINLCWNGVLCRCVIINYLFRCVSLPSCKAASCFATSSRSANRLWPP